MAEQPKWTPDKFGRRVYTIEGDALDSAKRIRLRIEVDGKQICDMQIREPGIMAIISRPSEQGIDLEIIEPGGARFTDVETPDGRRTLPLEAWQIEQLRLSK
jgi:hypothetical protein